MNAESGLLWRIPPQGRVGAISPPEQIWIPPYALQYSGVASGTAAVIVKRT